jgi:hypothetical protein
VAVGADELLDGAELEGGEDWLEPELEVDPEPELWCELPWLLEEPPSGSTYWLSPAEPPPWAKVTAGAASASTASRPRQMTNGRQAVTG